MKKQGISMTFWKVTITWYKVIKVLWFRNYVVIILFYFIKFFYIVKILNLKIDEMRIRNIQ